MTGITVPPPPTLTGSIFQFRGRSLAAIMSSMLKTTAIGRCARAMSGRSANSSFPQTASEPLHAFNAVTSTPSALAIRGQSV